LSFTTIIGSYVRTDIVTNPTESANYASLFTDSNITLMKGRN
jgi:hypothetical protein